MSCSKSQEKWAKHPKLRHKRTPHSPAEAKANAMALNDKDNGRTHIAHMAFDEISGSNSTALPYGGDEFARLIIVLKPW